MKGSPAKMGRIQGTAGHASALKMKAEADAAASALKQTVDGVDLKTSLGGKIKSLPALFPGGKSYGEAKAEQRAKGNVSNKTKQSLVDAQANKSKTKKNTKMSNENWKKGQDKAKSSGRDLDALVKSRKSLKKGSDEYNVVQNQINNALGNKKVHGATSSTETKGKTTTTTSNKPGISSDVSSTKTTRRGKKTVTKKTLSNDKENTDFKTKTIKDKEGNVKRRKSIIKSDYDKDNKIDKKTKLKTKYNKDGTVKSEKRVTREGGRRTVRKTDKEGNSTTKSRRTIMGFLTGKGKEKKNSRMPAPSKKSDKY